MDLGEILITAPSDGSRDSHAEEQRLNMTKSIDPEVVMTTIRESVEASKTRSRRILCRTLLTNFGFRNRTPDRMALLDSLFEQHGIHVDPLPSQAERDGWLHMTLDDDWPKPTYPLPHPQLSDSWFTAIHGEVLESEREVEMHFVSPLFQQLGYGYDHEVAEFKFVAWQGVTKLNPEADLVYFENTDHSIDHGNLLVLVECKTPAHKFPEGVGQARSYAYWLKPVYYVVTNGDYLVAYLNQGGTSEDPRVLEITRANLQNDFAKAWDILNYDAAREAKRQNKVHVETTISGL